MKHISHLLPSRKLHRARCAVLGAAAALGMISCWPALAQERFIIEYPLPRPDLRPGQIVLGPDGALWFTETGPGVDARVGRISASGTISEFSLPGQAPLPSSLVAGRDGALWVATLRTHEIVRLETTGATTSFGLPYCPRTNGVVLATGADGNIWFTTATCGTIDRLTTLGQITEFPLPTASTPAPMSITSGYDGALWFLDHQNRTIGRMTMNGSVSWFSVPFGGVMNGLTSGPDQAIWITRTTGPTADLLRLDSHGNTRSYPLPSPAFSTLASIVTGSDEALWFTEWNGNKVGRLDAVGSLTWLDVPTPNAYPAGIAVGPEGDIWFTESVGNRIGHIVGSGRTAVAVPAASAAALAVLAVALMAGSLLVLTQARRASRT